MSADLLILLGIGLGAILAWGVHKSPVAPTSVTVALLIVAALMATITGVWGMTLALATVVLLFGVDALLARGSIRGERVLATTLPRSYPAPMELRIERNGPGRMHVRQPRVGDIWMEHYTAKFGFETTIRPRRRGTFQIPQAWVRATGPFELAAWRSATDTAAELRVMPDLPRVERIRQLVRMNTFRDPSERRRGPLGLGTEFELVRDYVPDDDIRQVNWRATARTGRAMSNQYRLEQDRDVICLIDIGRLMASSIGEQSRIDLAVDAVTAIARVADDMGDRVGFLAFDNAIREDQRPRRRAFESVLHRVFDLEASEADSDFELAFRSVGNRKRALVLVFTDIQDEAASRAMVDAATFLTRRHMVVFASTIDPDLDVRVHSKSTTELDPARAMVLHELAAERARVAAKVAGSGAQVIDELPETFVEACVGRYLWAKRNARL